MQTSGQKMHKHSLIIHNFLIREARNLKKKLKNYQLILQIHKKIKRYSFTVDRLRILENKIHVYTVYRSTTVTFPACNCVSGRYTTAAL